MPDFVFGPYWLSNSIIIGVPLCAIMRIMFPKEYVCLTFKFLHAALYCIPKEKFKLQQLSVLGQGTIKVFTVVLNIVETNDLQYSSISDIFFSMIRVNFEIVECRVRVDRCLQNYDMPIQCSKEQRCDVERTLSDSFKGFADELVRGMFILG